MHFLDLPNEVRIHYSALGVGRPLLFFNGFSHPLEFWDPLVTRLMDDNHVIRFDARNAGATSFEGEFTLDDVAGDGAQLLDHLGLSDAVIVGHAWGGRLAQVFARNFPERTSGLIICGTGGQFPAKVDKDVLARLRQASIDRQREEWEAALSTTFCGPGFPIREPDRFQALADILWLKPPNNKARWDQTVSPSAGYWGLAEVPACLIYGTHDLNGTPENAKDLHDQFADSELHFIEGAGHFVVAEQPDQVAFKIKEFLNRYGKYND
jgi:pimeloyl-ACP methyl ester carboxylesterase